MENFNLLTDIQYIFYHIAQLYYNLASQHCLTRIIDQNCRLCHRLDNIFSSYLVNFLLTGIFMLCYFSVSSSQIIYFPSFWKVLTSSLFQQGSYFCLISILLEGVPGCLGDHSILNQLALSSYFLLLPYFHPSGKQYLVVM